MARRYHEPIPSFGDQAMLAFFVIMFISVAIRYLFASGGAYVAAMVPVFATVGMVAGLLQCCSLWAYCSRMLMAEA